MVLQSLHYGSNYRLSEWQGAVLSAQLGRLDEQTARGIAMRVCWISCSLKSRASRRKGSIRAARARHYAYIFHFEPKAFASAPVEN